MTLSGFQVSAVKAGTFALRWLWSKRVGVGPVAMAAWPQKLSLKGFELYKNVNYGRAPNILFAGVPRFVLFLFFFSSFGICYW